MKFLTPLVTQKHSEPGEFILFRDFKVKLDMCVATVPRGFITDFASVPRLAQLLPGFNRTEASAQAAVLHDWAYCCRGVLPVVWDYQPNVPSRLLLTRRLCDKLLYDGLRASGYSWLTASLFYGAVRAGGWLHWNRRKDGLDFSEDFVPDNFNWDAP